MRYGETRVALQNAGVAHRFAPGAIQFIAGALPDGGVAYQEGRCSCRGGVSAGRFAAVAFRDGTVWRFFALSRNAVSRLLSF